MVCYHYCPWCSRQLAYTHVSESLSELVNHKHLQSGTTNADMLHYSYLSWYNMSKKVGFRSD